MCIAHKTQPIALSDLFQGSKSLIRLTLFQPAKENHVLALLYGFLRLDYCEGRVKLVIFMDRKIQPLSQFYSSTEYLLPELIFKVFCNLVKF